MIALAALALPALSFLIRPSHAALHDSLSSQGQDLAPRGNDYSLKCGNAPSVIAGTETLDSAKIAPNALTEPPALSGSSEHWMDYLWCTNGTKTYTFFGVGVMTPGQPAGYAYNVAGAMAAAQAATAEYLTSHEDGPIEGGNWTMSPPGTDVEIYIQNSKATMTYGIMDSALKGLLEVATHFMNKQTTMVFQINDDHWGEVGIGYAGFKYKESKDNCIYDVVDGTPFACSDVKAGWVIK